jgi:hypothetical protein
VIGIKLNKIGSVMEITLKNKIFSITDNLFQYIDASINMGVAHLSEKIFSRWTFERKLFFI